jgi:hypothetical protein
MGRMGWPAQINYETSSEMFRFLSIIHDKMCKIYPIFYNNLCV